MAFKRCSCSIRDYRNSPFVADPCDHADVFCFAGICYGNGQRVDIDGRPFRESVGQQVIGISGDNIFNILEFFSDFRKRLARGCSVISESR